MLFGCQAIEDMEKAPHKASGTIRFAMRPLVVSVEDESATRSAIDSSNSIKHVWYAILDESGDVIRSSYSAGEEVSEIFLEGLEVGNYTAVFMATTEDTPLNPTLPEDITTPWVTHTDTDRPFEKDYLYKQLPFNIHQHAVNQTLEVVLQRLAGRVAVHMPSLNPQVEQLIKKVEIVFDAGATVASFMLGNGSYGGDYKLSEVDITEGKSFCSLPGKGLSGKVRITQLNDWDTQEESVKTYRFEQLDIEPGLISIVNIDYLHPEEHNGELRVKESSYTMANSTIMFLDSEPASTIHSRRFSVSNPLSVSIDRANKQLLTRWFSPIEMMDVKIMIKFKRYSSKFFHFARYDVIHPFQESKMSIPVMHRECKFIAEDGEQVWIPAQPELSEDNCEIKIVYPDTPYLQKIQQIKSKWVVSFTPPTSDPTSPIKIMNMVPEHARHICVMAVNMAYMFSTDYFQEELNQMGRLYDDFKNTINKAELLRTLQTKKGLNFGILEPSTTVEGYGGGEMITMLKPYYKNFYAEYEAPNNAMNESRMTLFHELAHCLGYGHASNMTNDAGEVAGWPGFCSRVYYDLSIGNHLPIRYKNIVEELPR